MTVTIRIEPPHRIFSSVFSGQRARSVWLPLALALALLFPTAPGGAQGTEPNEDAAAAAFDFDFSIYAWQYQRTVEIGQNPETIPPLMYWLDGDWQELDLVPGRKTPPFRYRGSSPLRLYLRNENNPSESPTLYAEVELKSDTGNIVVLLFHRDRIEDSAGRGLVRAHSVHVDSSKFQAGKPLFFNLSNQRLALRYGERRELLEPGAAISLPTAPNHARIPLELATETNRSWSVVFSSSIYLGGDSPTLVVLEPVDGSSRWQVVRIPVD